MTEPATEGTESNDYMANSPADFVEACASPTRVFGRQPAEQRWVFRGQADTRWALVPRVFRRYFPFDNTSRTWARLPLPPILDVVRDEARLLKAFRDRADQSGLTVPEHPFQDWELLDWAAGTDPPYLPNHNWPPVRLIPLIAFAQHNGVPTRMFDWTWSALVAACFAALDAEALQRADPDPARLLGVWSLCPARLPLPDAMRGRFVPHGESPCSYGGTAFFRPVDVPKASNPNLRAQQGALLLMHHGLSDHFVTPRVEITPLDESLAAYSDPRPILRKVVLPASLATEVLQLLTDRGVDAAVLFPDYRGVVRAVER